MREEKKDSQKGFNCLESQNPSIGLNKCSLSQVDCVYDVPSQAWGFTFSELHNKGSFTIMSSGCKFNALKDVQAAILVARTICLVQQHQIEDLINFESSQIK